MKRKILCLFLTLALSFSLSISAFASEINNYSAMSNAEISELSGIPVEDLIEARDVYGDEFDAVIADYINSTVHIDHETRAAQPKVLADADTSTSYISKSRISDTNWEFMKEKFKKGQILITDDATTLGYNHGHAAILYSTTNTVEHLGKNTTTYSGYYDVSWWQSFDTIKSFNYSDADIMSSAANYAYNNLRGKEYNVIADRTSSKVNCATLVWKAYNSQGVNIVDSTSGTVKPQDFDTSSKISWVRSVGWNNVDWAF